MASIGLVNAYFFVFFMFFIAMGFGVFSLMTQLHGDRKFKDLGKLTGSAVTVSFILGLLLWVIFIRGLEIFLVLWNVESSVVEISRQYAKGLGPGLPFSMHCCARVGFKKLRPDFRRVSIKNFSHFDQYFTKLHFNIWFYWISCIG